MARVHDMGGRPGQGRIVMDKDEHPFHADWEARMWGLNEAMWGPDSWTLDWWRYVRELIQPNDYLTRPYFDQWMQTFSAMMVDSGIATVAEIASGKSDGSHPQDVTLARAADVAKASATTRDFRRPTDQKPVFKPGDKVRTKTLAEGFHTRLPGYLMNRTGTVHAHRGNHLLPDAGAKGREVAQHLYTITFSGADLWPGEGRDKDRMNADLWESYLERA